MDRGYEHTRSRLLAVALVALVTLSLPLAAQRTLNAAAWRQDLSTLADTLRARHPKLLLPAERVSFDRKVAAARDRIPRLDRAGRIAELARVVASLHDGHTQMGLVWDDAIGFRSLPVRLYVFDDGVYVIRADSLHADLLGSRVEGIGDVPIDSAITRLRPWIHGDNESAFRDIIASRLVLAELLTVAGITQCADSVRMRVRLADGSSRASVLKPIERKAPLALIDARPAEAPTPLYLRDRSKPFWFEDLDSLGIFWIQFNAVQNGESETLAAFAERAMTAADRSSATALVIDIRRNNGGDNTLLRPFIVSLIRSRFNQTGRLFVVTGRLTFSAAMNFATQVQRYTEATFVGEPTGAPPNHYGETTRLRLPNSGITVLYSSLLWQDADPRDRRPWIAPSVPVPVRFADYRAGRDPVLDSILTHRIR